MKKKLIGILVCAVMAGSLLTGCRGREENEKPGSLKDEITQAIKDVTGDKDIEGDGLITIGFSQVGAESDWRIANTASMKKALSEENGFSLLYADAQQKQENQTKAVRDFISQAVDVIVLAPVTETGWDTVLGEAKTAGIPVIIVDRMIDVSDDSLYTCWLGSDFKQEGVDAAKWLVDYMDKQGRGADGINIVVLQGTIGSSAEIGRTEGFGNEIAKHGNYEILAQQTADFTQARGKEVTEAFLNEFEQVDVIVAQNDNMAFGAIDAVKEAGKKPGEDIVIVSFDAVKAAFEAMIAGDMNVSIECNPLHGPRVAELAKKIIAGEAVEKIQYVEEGVYPADTAAERLPERQY